MVWVFPGASWFYHQLIPSALPVPSHTLDPRAHMAVWQLVNCVWLSPNPGQALLRLLAGYCLLALLSSFVFRAVRDALPNNPVAQERILGASFLALGIADVSASCCVLSAIGLTES